METLIKNRHFIWIAAALLFGLYNAPSIVRTLTPRHEEKPSPTTTGPDGPRIPPTPTPPVDKPSSPPPVAAPAPFLFPGTWEGKAMLPARGGACAMTLKIEPGADADHPFSAFSKLICMQTMMAMEARGKITPAEAMNNMTRQLNPVSAILSGHPADGGLAFTVDKNIGLAEVPGSCPMTSLTATPFSEQLSVQWKETGEGACQGAEIMLDRSR